MGGDFLRRVRREGGDVITHLWRMSTPAVVALFGFGFGCIAVNEAHETAMRVGLCLGGGLIAWALGLAYERGHAAASKTWGMNVLGMLVDGAESTVTVTHEHRASPEALAIIRADAALARDDAGRAGEGGGTGSGEGGANGDHL